MKLTNVTQIERGWAGHFICSYRCLFRRNTLLKTKQQAVVVSTVGCMMRNSEKMEFEKIGINRYYETMAFMVDADDVRYQDADVSKQVTFDSPWCIDRLDADDEANNMHDTVVKELKMRMSQGEMLYANPSEAE